MTNSTDQERAARQDCIDQSLASVRLEGLEPSEDAKAIFEQFVNGELTVDEMGEAIRAMHARKYGPVHISGD